MSQRFSQTALFSLFPLSLPLSPSYPLSLSLLPQGFLFRFNCLLKANCAAIARWVNDPGMCWLATSRQVSCRVAAVEGCTNSTLVRNLIALGVCNIASALEKHSCNLIWYRASAGLQGVCNQACLPLASGHTLLQESVKNNFCNLFFFAATQPQEYFLSKPLQFNRIIEQKYKHIYLYI